MPTAVPTEPVWHNGHKFVLDADLTLLMEAPVATCAKCGHRSDSAYGQMRPCLGHDLYIPPTGNGLHLQVEFTPKGRKTIKESVWLDIDALGALLDLARQMSREHRGHAYWHWRNPERDFPCDSCPSPLGDTERALVKARAEAIDVEAGREADRFMSPTADTVLAEFQDEDDPRGTADVMTADRQAHGRLRLKAGNQGVPTAFIEDALQDDAFDLPACYDEPALEAEVRRLMASYANLQYDDLGSKDRVAVLQRAKDRLKEQNGWTCALDGE